MAICTDTLCKIEVGFTFSWLIIRTIYDQMGKVGDFEFQEMCKQKLEEIEPSIRYCNYKLGKKDSGEGESIRAMKAEADSLGLDLLQSKLDVYERCT